MAWQYDKVSAHQAPSVLSQLEDKMDGLGHYAALGAKTAAADARHDLARAFIFWNEDISEVPSASPNGPWAKQVWSTVDNFSTICDDIRDKLNELQSNLTSKAFFAKLMHTDAKYQSSHFALYCPVG